uniref:Uncharacterized protein n=1 Tax=Parascaris univalens TaxID=6257 RepID=A0A915A6E1_PARUN
MNGTKEKIVGTQLLPKLDQDPAPPDLCTVNSSVTLQRSVRSNIAHRNKTSRRGQNSFKKCNLCSENICFLICRLSKDSFTSRIRHRLTARPGDPLRTACDNRQVAYATENNHENFP